MINLFLAFLYGLNILSKNWIENEIVYAANIEHRAANISL